MTNPYDSPPPLDSQHTRTKRRLLTKDLLFTATLLVACSCWVAYLMIECVPPRMKYHDKSGTTLPGEMQIAMAYVNRIVLYWPIVLILTCVPFLLTSYALKGNSKKVACRLYCLLVSFVSLCFSAWVTWAVLSAPNS